MRSATSRNSHLVLRRGAFRLPEASSRIGRVRNFATGCLVKQAPAVGWRGRDIKGRHLWLLPNFAYPLTAWRRPVCTPGEEHIFTPE